MTKGKTESKVSNDEQVGFHKGSLSTLAKEREELLKMVSVVEQLMQLHINALKELGVDLAKQAAEMKKEAPSDKKKKNDKPIEDMLK